MHTAFTDDDKGGQAYESMLYDHHHQLNQGKKRNTNGKMQKNIR